ncbi:MAG TPA: immunity 22 family protein [Tissierellales bacterium]|nr:immunity 22 family protein [Tissierellales bacterium]
MKNYVSLWLGNFLSSDDVEKYTKVRYTEDGDSIFSQFEKDFRLEYYDRDLIEKDWISELDDNIKNLLIGFSYDDKLLNEFHSIDKI